MAQNKKGSILIVDDEVCPREYLRMILKYFTSYEVHTAGNGKEALDFIKEEKVDLVILDLIMPGLSGIDFLREIKKINEKIGFIININTTYETTEEINEAMRLGAFGFVPTSYDVSDVISIVERFFEKSEPDTDQQ